MLFLLQAITLISVALHLSALQLYLISEQLKKLQVLWKFLKNYQKVEWIISNMLDSN